MPDAVATLHPDRKPRPRFPADSGSARRTVAGCLAALMALAGGCTPTHQRLAPAGPDDAISRVNRNLARIDRPLQYKAFVSVQFRDDSGATRRLLGQEATLLFAPVRQLRLDIRSLAGQIAQFGSDGQHYWLWIEPQVRKLWWGRWDSLSDRRPSRLTLPPEDLLDVLMLRPLPLTLEGGLSPLLRRQGQDQRLLFVRLDGPGQPACGGPRAQLTGLREIRLDPTEPYQPTEIIDRLPDGRIRMLARLENYQPVEPGGPYTPRRYTLVWPLDGTQMRIDVTGARFRPDLPSEVFAFPRTWNGQIERLDTHEYQPAPAPPGIVGP